MQKKRRKGIGHYIKRGFRYLEGILYLLKSVLSDRQFLYLSCVVVGISSALAVTVLKTFAHSVFELATYLDSLLKLPYINSILPVAGIVLTVFVIRKFLDGSIEKGTAHIMIAVAKRSGMMPRKQMYAQIITSSLTVGMGGSAGLESPITITGAAFGSNFAQNYRLNYKDRTLLLACGVASGIATAFNAPIAGVLFAIEVILADMSVSAFIPIMISSATGAIMANITLKEGILLSFKKQLSFDFHNTFYYVILGILCGLVAVYHARLFRKVEHSIGHYSKNVYKRALVGAGILALLIFLFPTLFGEGYESIKALSNNQAGRILENSLLESFKRNQWVVLGFVAATMLIKAAATGLTLGSGGNGGNFAPSLFVGSYLGFVLSKFITLIGLKDLPIGNFTVVGMAGVLSGLFHAPLTAIFLIAEITGGYGLIVPLMIVSSISFAIAKRYDKYSMDIFTIADKGIVFTSDKDKNLLNRIELHQIYHKEIQTLSLHASLKDVKHIFAATRQQFIPVTDEQKHVLGVIDLDRVRSTIFSDFQIKYSNFIDCISDAVTASISENAGNVIELMDKHKTDYVVLTQDNKWVGYVTKNDILQVYRENLKNLRIE